MGTKRKTLSDAKAELNNITERRGKVVQNLKISLDDYNNKKEEAQEAIARRGGGGFGTRARVSRKRKSFGRERGRETRFDGRLQAEKDDYVEKKAALDSFIDAQTGLQGELSS